MTAFLLLLLAYLLGSIPFGLVLTKLCGLGDIRSIGSGNIGATNVLRTGKKGLAVATLLLDIAKGAAAVLIAGQIMPELTAYAALFALLGHMFPVWLKFKGGKGVATMLGALLALSWPAGLFAILIWLATAFSFRISSLSALISIGTAPVFFTIFEKGPAIAVILMMVLLIFIKHADNFMRLMNGTEPKIGQKKDHDQVA